MPELNARLNFDQDEASSLWETGKRVRKSRKQYLVADRVRRSEDGEWLIKRFRPQDGVSSKRAAEIGSEEFIRLQELGLNIVSFAMTPIEPKTLLIVSPWLDGIRKASKAERQSQVAPALTAYFEAAAEGTQPYRPYLTGEIAMPEQYSVLTNTGQVFLTDVEPYIHTSGTPVIAKSVLAYQI